MIDSKLCILSFNWNFNKPYLFFKLVDLICKKVFNYIENNLKHKNQKNFLPSTF